MHFWSLLSTTEEGELGQRGGEEGGGVKGASISDFNGRDGAITSIEGQYPRLACFLYMVINTARISLKIFCFYDQKGHVPPISVQSNVFYTL